MNKETSEKKQKKRGRTTMLQIGGTVSPNDKVAMHVELPQRPGIGVAIKSDSGIDEEVKEISKKIDDNEPKAKEIKKLVDEILKERDKSIKLQKMSTLVMIGAGITSIASELRKITTYLGF